jgi:hypothetical protein
VNSATIPTYLYQLVEGKEELTLIGPHNNYCATLAIYAVTAVSVPVRFGVGHVVDVDFGEI